MITKLLTVSAFTLALATGAMAQTGGSDTGDSGSDTGSATDSATTGSTTGSAANNTNPGGGTKDDDRCTETSAEATSSTPSGTMPDAACED